MKLADRVAIVTGGGGAIGRAIARRLDEEGATVGVAVVREHSRRDALVNNAGTHVQALVENMPGEDWDRVVRTDAYSSSTAAGRRSRTSGPC